MYRRLRILAPILLVLTGCGVSTQHTRGETLDQGASESGVEGNVPSRETHLVATSGGVSHILLRGPLEGIEIGSLIELVPRGEWPDGDADRPAQALLRVTRIEEDAAHALVLGARARGARLVLVVTGKGRDRDEGGPIPAPRGALRHQLPAWLAQPPLAGAVLQVAEAHRRHGGSGAYYIYLRRQPGRD